MEDNSDSQKISAEEDAQASHLLEIINEKALETLERTEEARDSWSMEMGDDSVFYSDEEQARQSGEAAVLFGFSGNKCRNLVNNVEEGEADQQKNAPGDETMAHQGNSVRRWDVEWTGEENRHFQKGNTKKMHQSETEKFMKTREFLPSSLMDLDKSINESAGKVSYRKEETMEEARSHLDPGVRVKVHLCAAEPQKSDTCSEENLEILKAPQNPNQDHSSSSQPKESDIISFNHLDSSKYSTVSYRKIQRGNTRQRIEEFEFILNKQ